MEKYTDIELNGKYKISAGTKFYCHALKEEVVADKDLIVKVTTLTAFTPGLVHGILQDVIINPFLQIFFGSASNVYTDREDSKISVHFNFLKKI